MRKISPDMKLLRDCLIVTSVDPMSGKNCS
jgi:hypothetical protein